MKKKKKIKKGMILKVTRKGNLRPVKKKDDGLPIGVAISDVMEGGTVMVQLCSSLSFPVVEMQVKHRVNEP